MPTVGIRELKDKLSHYLKRVERGEWIAITNRGKVIALLTPAGRDLGEGALRLIEEGLASWTGGKPHGSPYLVKVRGRPLSELVVEDRR